MHKKTSQHGALSKVDKINFKRAFTLIEIIVTISVIGLLASVSILSYGGWQKSIIATTLKNDLSNVFISMESFRNFGNSYPTSIPNSFKSSDGVVLTGGSNDGGKTFCVSAVSTKDPSVKFYISSESGKREAQTGSCPQAGPSTPVIAVSLNVADVLATVTPVTCATGTAQYGFRFRTNDGVWSDYSAWSTGLTSSQLANDGVKYGYQAQVRCYVDIDNISLTTTGTEVAYIDSIAAPNAPVVVANTVTDTTTYSWTAPTCAAGTTARYQYRFTISPVGYDSGLIATPNSLVSFTTFTEGQTYTVVTQAQCYNANTTSSWSSNSNNGSYTHQPPVIIAPASDAITTSGAILSSNISANGGFPVTESGTCWGTTPNPISNCLADNLGDLTPLSVPIISTASFPAKMTISQDGTSAYVANINTNTISMYSRNTATGQLTPLGTPTIAAGLWTKDVVISPDGNSVYALNMNAYTISMYSRNTSTGALTALGTPTIAAGSASVIPRSIAISPDSKSVYLSAGSTGNGSVWMYSRNTSTGALTALAAPTIPAGDFPLKLTVSPDGNSVYVSNMSSANISMYSRNISTGALTALSTPTIASGSSSGDVIVSADNNNVYVTISGSVYMYSRNTSTGLLTPLGTPSIVVTSSLASIAISPDGNTVYVTDDGTSQNNISILRRNIATGALTTFGNLRIPAEIDPIDIEVSSDGNFVYAVNSNISANSISMYRRKNSNMGAFYQARSAMPSNTLIYYRGYAVNSAGISYSPDGSFTTKAAYSLIGAAGSVVQGADSASVVPTWGAGSSRTAGNLLVCAVSFNGVATIPATPAGWILANSIAGTSTAAAVYYKVATGNDTAPTIAGVASRIIAAQLFEFSGGSKTLDTSGNLIGTASPRRVVAAGYDTGSNGQLIITASSLRYSVAAAKTITDIVNNATAVSTTSAALSTLNHYAFSYGISTTNSLNATNTLTFTSTSITGVAGVIATFK